VVDKTKVIDGKNVKSGDVLIGFKSVGLHTNGYSLARKVLLEKYKVTDNVDLFENNIGTELLTVHKSYLKLITLLKNNIEIKAFSHITGGGIIGNTKRVTPKNLKLKIDWNAWDILPIFKLIKETGNISDLEMQQVFNLGIGLIAIVDKTNANKVIELANSINEQAIVIGAVE